MKNREYKIQKNRNSKKLTEEELQWRLEKQNSPEKIEKQKTQQWHNKMKTFIEIDMEEKRTNKKQSLEATEPEITTPEQAAEYLRQSTSAGTLKSSLRDPLKSPENKDIIKKARFSEGPESPEASEASEAIDDSKDPEGLIKTFHEVPNREDNKNSDMMTLLMKLTHKKVAFANQRREERKRAQEQESSDLDKKRPKLGE